MKTELPVMLCKTRKSWATWLGKHHEDSAGVWLQLAKKDAGSTSVSYAEAVEEALCHGWIAGQKQAMNEQFWLQKFTPRSSRSIWSQINKEKAEALIASGAMQAAGLREVERAKSDGRWDAAYASARKATVPDDLSQALAANPGARAFFDQLDGANRYAILFRIQTVKRAETRERKIAQFVAMLARGEKIHA
jgi:uncharacterized protein YdeI (YjbR/CyaY-like superfamily)